MRRSLDVSVWHSAHNLHGVMPHLHVSRPLPPTPAYALETQRRFESKCVVNSVLASLRCVGVAYKRYATAAKICDNVCESGPISLSISQEPQPEIHVRGGIRGVPKKFGEWTNISMATWARCVRIHMAIQRHVNKCHPIWSTCDCQGKPAAGSRT